MKGEENENMRLCGTDPFTFRRLRLHHTKSLTLGAGVNNILNMKRARQHTASAAVLAVGSELSRRGYDVTFTLGNTRKVDMMCSVPDGKAFKIQVKGISDRYSFFIDKSFFETHPDEDLFLVVVLVPINNDSPLRFFLLPHVDAICEFKKMPTRKRDGRLYENGSGLNWGSVKSYESVF
jgi:hypothetical protein